MLQPEIIEKPELLIVGFEASFIHALSPDATNFQVIGPLWERLIHNSTPVPNRIGNAMYGVIYGRNEEERSHPDELQYVAGVPVSEEPPLPDEMVFHRVPGGTFAVFFHRGPIENIGETCRQIYRVWLPESDYEHSQIADVEVYDERFSCDSSDSVMEYWISVKPKTN